MSNASAVWLVELYFTCIFIIRFFYWSNFVQLRNAVLANFTLAKCQSETAFYLPLYILPVISCLCWSWETHAQFLYLVQRSLLDFCFYKRKSPNGLPLIFGQAFVLDIPWHSLFGISEETSTGIKQTVANPESLAPQGLNQPCQLTSPLCFPLTVSQPHSDKQTAALSNLPVPSARQLPGACLTPLPDLKLRPWLLARPCGPWRYQPLDAPIQSWPAG